jgi:hypothetical protein
MRKIAIAIFLILASSLPVSAAAISDAGQKPTADDIPTFVIDGLTAYKNKGPEEAVRVWIKGSPLDGSKDALSQANSLHQVQDFYGSYLSFELVNVRILAPSVKIVYIVLDYEKGPLFGRFVVYHSDHGWILTSFDFNTHEEQIIPNNLQWLVLFGSTPQSPGGCRGFVVLLVGWS